MRTSKRNKLHVSPNPTQETGHTKNFEDTSQIPTITHATEQKIQEALEIHK